MVKQKNTQIVIIAVLAVAVLVMSVGFAASAYTKNLSVNGSNVNVQASKWDVHFDSTSYTESAGSVVANSKTLTGTNMTYDVTLTKPGDFYEFTVAVENLGTFDANLTALTMSGLTTEQSKYLVYTIDYNGTQYTSSQSSISGVTLSKTDGTAPVKVRVEYVQPADSTQLPTTDQTISLTAALTYTQVQ